MGIELQRVELPEVGVVLRMESLRLVPDSSRAPQELCLVRADVNSAQGNHVREAGLPQLHHGPRTFHHKALFQFRLDAVPVPEELDFGKAGGHFHLPHRRISAWSNLRPA